MKTGDEVDLKRRAVRVIDALPAGRLAAAVSVTFEAVLGPDGGKLVFATFVEVYIINETYQ